MKYKVEELEGTLLDAAVAKAEAYSPPEFVDDLEHPYLGAWTKDGDLVVIGNGYGWQPSTNWSYGGPIIDREQIALEPPWDKPLLYTGPRTWSAWVPGPTRAGGHHVEPLTAAMRAHVTNKLGKEIDLP